MKPLVIILLLVIFSASCGKSEKKESNPPGPVSQKQTPENLGKEIFEGKGNCVACHQPNQKVVGPSIQQIASV